MVFTGLTYLRLAKNKECKSEMMNNLCKIDCFWHFKVLHRIFSEKMRILFKSPMLSADRDLPVDSSLKGVSCFVSFVKLQFTSSWNEHEWKLFWLLQRVLVSEHVQSLHWGEKSVKMLEIVFDHIIARATASPQCVSLVWWRTSSHVLSLLDIGWVVQKTGL